MSIKGLASAAVRTKSKQGRVLKKKTTQPIMKTPLPPGCAGLPLFVLALLLLEPAPTGGIQLAQKTRRRVPRAFGLVRGRAAGLTRESRPREADTDQKQNQCLLHARLPPLRALYLASWSLKNGTGLRLLTRLPTREPEFPRPDRSPSRSQKPGALSVRGEEVP